MGSQLLHLGVVDPRYPFCGHLESFKHLFWLCFRAQQFWQWIHDFFRHFWPEPFSWHMVLLGDSPGLPSKFSQLWHNFRVVILFHIWKVRNSCIFSYIQMDKYVSLNSSTPCIVACVLPVPTSSHAWSPPQGQRCNHSHTSQ